MPTFEEKYAELKKKRDEMEKEFQSLAGELFKEKASGLFEKYPTLKSFGWAQYTPYFNDGDECIFGVNDENIYLEMDGESVDEDSDEHNYGFDAWSINYKIKHEGENSLTESERAALDASDFLKTFEEQTLKFMFGDHARITINRDGTSSVDGYDHD